MSIVVCASGHLRTNWLSTVHKYIKPSGAVGVFWNTIGMYNPKKLNTVYDNRKVQRACPEQFHCRFELFPSPKLIYYKSVVLKSPQMNERMLSMYHLIQLSFTLGRDHFPNATWYMRIRPDCRFVRPFILPCCNADVYLPEHMYWPNVPNDMVFLVRNPAIIESNIINWMQTTRLGLSQAELILTRFADNHNMSYEIGREGKNHWFILERKLIGPFTNGSSA